MEFFVRCPGLIFLAARWSGPAASTSIFSVCLDYIIRVCQSLWDSFLSLGKLHWFLYLLVSYFYDPGMFIFRWSSNFVEKVVLNESMSAKMASHVSYLVLLLYIAWIWTNYCKLPRTFVGAIRTTTINCRLSFIDLYLVFPRHFWMVFLPNTNTVILLEPYCATITEPGLPVLIQWIRSPKPLLFKTAFNKSPLRTRPHESGVKNIRIRVEGASILFAVGSVNASRQGQQNNSNVQKRCKKIVVKSLTSVKKSLFFFVSFFFLKVS